MGYMRWAKTHRRVRYELTGSGAPPAAPTDLAAHLASADLEVRGPYGDPRLIDAVAGRYAVPTGGVVPVVGASSGVFIALAVAVGQGDSAIIEHPSYDPLYKAANHCPKMLFATLPTAVLLRTPLSSSTRFTWTVRISLRVAGPGPRPIWETM